MKKYETAAGALYGPADRLRKKKYIKPLLLQLIQSAPTYKQKKTQHSPRTNALGRLKTAFVKKLSLDTKSPKIAAN